MDLQTKFDALVNGSISGVYNLSSVPSQINTAQLPCKYVKYGSTLFAISSLGNNLGLPTHSFEIVFLIESVGQNNNVQNQTSVLSIASQVYDYLDAINNIITVESSFSIILINGFSYWGFVVTVTILGD